jgi:hypothetical protein
VPHQESAEVANSAIRKLKFHRKKCGLQKQTRVSVGGVVLLGVVTRASSHPVGSNPLSFCAVVPVVEALESSRCK